MFLAKAGNAQSGADSWGKSVPNVWTTNSEGPPSELSPGSSNDAALVVVERSRR